MNKIEERKEFLKEEYDDILDEILEIDEMLEYHKEEISNLKKRKNMLGKKLEKIANEIAR